MQLTFKNNTKDAGKNINSVTQKEKKTLTAIK